MSLRRVVLLAALVATAAHSLWAVHVGWEHHILEMHGFRQTQTAITAYYLLHGGPWLAYETPVFGAPWSIPFELPVYQGLVAAWARVSGVALDQASRGVSVAFFYLTLVPGWWLLRTLGVACWSRLPFLCLYLASPLYLFWSRTAMIESTAVFFGFVYLGGVAAFLASPTARGGACLAAAALGLAGGVVGALVKVTTFEGFALAALVLAGAALRREGLVDRLARDGLAAVARAPLRRLVGPPVLLFAAAPVGALVLWTRFSDAHKSANPLTAGFLESGSLGGHNFGALGERFTAGLWRRTLWERSLPDLFGSPLVVVVALALLLVPGLVGRRHRALVVVTAGVYLAVTLTFTRLHVVHNYYQYSNGVFLLASVAFVLVALLESASRRTRAAGTGALVLALGVSLLGYHAGLHRAQRHDRRDILPTAAFLAQATRSDEVALVFGLDWSAEVLYYAERRGIMNRWSYGPDDPPMRRALELLAGRRLTALVACHEERDQAAEYALRFGFSPVAAHRGEACQVHLRPAVP